MIPKKIFQTFEHIEFSPQFQKLIDDWKIENPEYEYQIYDKTQREEFIKINFSKEIFDAYQRIKPGAFKSDLWRYCILHKYGGFYMDIDTVCLGSLNMFMSEDIDFVAAIDLNLGDLEYHSVANAFIGCTPEHPVIDACIQRVISIVDKEALPYNIMNFCGPGCLGIVINNHLGRSEKAPMLGFHGNHNGIQLIHFEQYTEYIRNLDGKKILQNKNSHQQIKELYDLECSKVENYFDWGKFGFKNVQFEDIVNDSPFKVDDEVHGLRYFHKGEPAYFYLYKNDKISDCIKRGFKWEEHQHEVIDRYLNQDSVAIEVGSHIGTITTKLSKTVKQVYAFEPLKENFNMLKRNLLLNSCQNVKTIQNKINYSNTIDSYEFGKVDFIKIDASGFEDYILKGAKKTIEQNMPLIIVDIKAMDTLASKEILLDLGYKIQLEYFNDYLFIPPSLQGDEFGYMTQLFPNDNLVNIKIPEHKNMRTFRDRHLSEPIFRKIHTYLLNKGLIKNNIIDGGSWLGDNSIPWALMFPESIIYSIDPSKDNLYFQHLVADFNEINNLISFNTVLSDNSDPVYTNSDDFHMTFNKQEGKSEFKCCTLDELYSNGKIHNIGYIHLDVEGFEHNVIKGAINLISNSKPIISFEQHIESDDYLALSNLIKKYGYEVYQINEILHGNNLDCRNFIAFPKDLNIDVKSIEKSIKFDKLFSQI